MIYGIRPSNPTSIGGTQPSRTQQPGTTPSSDPRIDQQRAPAAPGGVAAQRPTQASSATAVPVQAPPGTDPELWSVLSADERVFFAKLGAMGPLTYGRVLSQAQPSAVPVARGGRLDVKV